VERVVLNALKKRIRRLISAPPVGGSASLLGEGNLLLARYRLVSLLFVAEATTTIAPPAGAKARRAVAI